MKRNIIADLDGTISFDHHRRKLIPDESIEHYFQACDRDTPNLAVIEMLEAMRMAGYDIHIVTGRSETTRSKTEVWLRENGVTWSSLNMRPIDTYRAHGRDASGFDSDPELKASICKLQGLTPDNTLMVLEDREEIVDAWRAMGFDCWQVCPRGKFY